jgi:hypothetical protein
VRAAYHFDKTAQDELKKITVSNRAFVWDNAHLHRLWLGTVSRVPLVKSGFFYENRKERAARLKEERKLLRSKPPCDPDVLGE